MAVVEKLTIVQEPSAATKLDCIFRSPQLNFLLHTHLIMEAPVQAIAYTCVLNYAYTFGDDCEAQFCWFT